MTQGERKCYDMCQMKRRTIMTLLVLALAGAAIEHGRGKSN